MRGALAVASSGKNSIQIKPFIIIQISCGTLVNFFGDCWKIPKTLSITLNSKYSSFRALYHPNISQCSISTLAASILSVTYGVDVRPEHDPNIERSNKALANFSDAAISGIFLVDILPFLKHVPSWMPGAGFKRFAEKSLPDTLDMMNTPFHEGCTRIVSDVYIRSRLLKTAFNSLIGLVARRKEWTKFLVSQPRERWL